MRNYNIRMIKSAEEILEECEDPIWAMKAYANQFIDLAIESCELEWLYDERENIISDSELINIKKLIK